MRGNLPTFSTHVLAETSKGGMLQIVGASGADAFSVTVVVDRTQVQFLREEETGICLAPPESLVIPPAPPEGSTAGYFQTDVQVVVQLPEYVDVYNKVTSALRKAESWGWSHVLANTRSILPVPFLRLAPAMSMTIPWLVHGITLVDMDFVDETKLEDLAWTMAHESLHHAFFRRIPFPVWYTLTHRYGFQESQHHLGIGLAFVMNAATLDALDLFNQANWPGRQAGYPPGGWNLTPTKPPTDTPLLRYKSVLQPVPDEFGQRLDAMATIIGNWGTGGWVDQFGPMVNYVGSGVPPSSPRELVLDLAKSDTELAWQVADRTMFETADKWAEYRRIHSWEAAKATDIGMLALMARLGLSL